MQIIRAVCLRSLGVQLSSCRTMSSSSRQPLDQRAENWFAKFQRAPEPPHNVFRGYVDRFNGITIDSRLEPTTDADEADFGQKLEKSLQFWLEAKRRGIWFKVDLVDSAWVPTLAKNGFKYHHARDDFVMMYKWLAEEPENVPPYAHTMIGVGCIVVNGKDQILAVSEKNALIPNSWKLPGGYAEPKENLPDAAMREVEEETNIKTTFDSVVSIRHAHGAGFGCSDIYVVMAMRPQTDAITRCEREIAACQWMDIDEFLQHPNVHETNRNFVRMYLTQQRTGFSVECRDEEHPLLKRKYQVYTVQSRDPAPSSTQVPTSAASINSQL